MTTSAAFANYVTNTVGMGNPLTPSQQYVNPFDPTKENEMIPWLIKDMQIERNKGEDPQRTRELLSVFQEFDERRALQAAELQKQRDQRSIAAGFLAQIPKTITETSANLAQMALNAPDLRIRAQIPALIQSAWGAFPDIRIPRARTFS